MSAWLFPCAKKLDCPQGSQYLNIPAAEFQSCRLIAWDSEPSKTETVRGMPLASAHTMNFATSIIAEGDIGIALETAASLAVIRDRLINATYASPRSASRKLIWVRRDAPPSLEGGSVDFAATTLPRRSVKRVVFKKACKASPLDCETAAALRRIILFPFTAAPVQVVLPFSTTTQSAHVRPVSHSKLSTKGECCLGLLCALFLSE